MPVLSQTDYQPSAQRPRNPDIDARSMQAIGETIITGIRRDAGEGLGPAGPLAPYDPETVRRKGTARVTLRDTGKLLATLKVRRLRDVVFVKATQPYARFVFADRPVMGMSARTIRRVRSDVDRAVSQ